MHFHVYDSPKELSEVAAGWITKYIEQQLKESDRFSILLSGGNTPKELYGILATDAFRHRIDWQRLHIFFGDERFVPFEDNRNNGKMAFDQLLKLVPVSSSQIHFIPTKGEAIDAAQRYEQLLREYFRDSPSSFDLALLGMGTDAHTLSLFPHSPVIHEKVKWVKPSKAPESPVDRITLTAPMVNASKTILFLVSGKSKAPAVREVVDGAFNPDLYPSQLISRAHQNVHFFADRDAMQLVTNYE